MSADIVARILGKSLTAADLWIAAEIEHPKPAPLAAVIMKREHFARDEGGRLYVFRHGTYIPKGKTVIDKWVAAILDHAGLSNQWSSNLANDTAEYVTRVVAPTLWEKPPCDRLNVKNGLLTVAVSADGTHELKLHDPEFLSPIQLPVTYNPTATCPLWEKQVAATFPEDANALAWRIIAYFMLAITWIQKAILLLGEGGTGKSTFLTGLISFLGKALVSSLSLHQLENDRFATARLVGRLANICADLPSTHLETTSIFRRITGGDELPAEYKFGDGFDFTPYARLIFSANQPPSTKDAGPAFFDRWLTVPFNNVYRGAQNERSRKDLDDELAKEGELSGVLNKALEVVEDVMAHGLGEPESCRRARLEFQQMTDPVTVWFGWRVVVAPDARVVKEELRRAYNEYAQKSGRLGMNQTAFSMAVKHTFKDVVGEDYSTIAGRREHVWTGIGLLAPQAEDDAQRGKSSAVPVHAVLKECKDLGIHLRLIDGGASFEVLGEPPERLSSQIDQYAEEILEILNRAKREKRA